MLSTAKSLIRYRSLLSTLTLRELKARYRGSVLGYLWSLVNPLLLLLVYSVVFGAIFPSRDPAVEPYGMFLVSGLFPWIWWQSSVMEGTGSLLANAGLIRKATFPVELLPVVPVFSNLVHFALTLPVLGAAYAYFAWRGEALGGITAIALPLIVLLQLPLTAGVCLAMAALNAHFKDVRDLVSNLLTIFFFLTPILYTTTMIASRPWVLAIVTYNPLTPFTRAYQDILFFGVWPPAERWLWMAVIAFAVWTAGASLFGRLSDTLVEAV